MARKAKQVGSWNEISDKTIEAFEEAVEALRKTMIPLDCDGDSAVQVIIIDRRKYESFHFQPILYSHRAPEGMTAEEVQEERLRWLHCNVEMAMTGLRVFLDLDLRDRVDSIQKKKDQAGVAKR